MAHVFGERALATLERLLSLLSAFEVVVWMTDGWPLYESRLKGELHVISRHYTQRIERHNLNLRQHLARLGRKSLSFSKSVELRDKIIGHYLNVKHCQQVEVIAPKPYRGRRKILVIVADERYLSPDDGRPFSTDNHPIGTLLPLYHPHATGLEFEVATISGPMTKFEYWAMSRKDEEATPFFEQHKLLFRNPEKLADVVVSLNADNEYAAIFVPDGHGALIGLPENQDMAVALQWTIKNDRFVISLCHNPAAFLTLRHDDNPLNGCSICAFPNAADKQTPEIGYMSGHLTWYFSEGLKKMGMNIIDGDTTRRVHKDRRVLADGSLFATNTLGRLAAQEVLAAYAD